MGFRLVKTDCIIYTSCMDYHCNQKPEKDKRVVFYSFMNQFCYTKHPYDSSRQRNKRGAMRAKTDSFQELDYRRRNR